MLSMFLRCPEQRCNVFKGNWSKMTYLSALLLQTYRVKGDKYMSHINPVYISPALMHYCHWIIEPRVGARISGVQLPHLI